MIGTIIAQDALARFAGTCLICGSHRVIMY